MIIGIIGEPYSGKKTLINYLTENKNFELIQNASNYQFNYHSLNSSKEETKATNKEIDSNFETFQFNPTNYWNEITNFRNDKLNKETEELSKVLDKTLHINQDSEFIKIIQEVTNRRGSVIIYPLTYDIYLNYNAQFTFKLIDIRAGVNKRFSNFAKKHENDDFSKFLDKNEKFDDSFYIHLQKKADYTIINNGSLELFYNNIEELIKSLNTKLRPSVDEYFMNMSFLVSKRSNCFKSRVGCVIVKDNRVVATGYNGTPSGVLNCFQGGCDRCLGASKSGNNLDKCLCIHAEENAIIDAGRHKCIGATIYTTFFPCLICAKSIAQAGITRLVYCLDYFHHKSDELLKSKNILIEQLAQSSNIFN